MSNENNSLDKALAELADDTQPTDAGAKARDKIDLRKPTLGKRLSKVATFVAWFIPILVISTGSVLWKIWDDRTITGYHYMRACALPKDVDMDVSGTRRYLNQSSKFLGMEFVDTTKADERTTLNASMKEISVTGIDGDEWWSIYNAGAEPRVLDLKPAEIYVFTQDNKTHVISYEEFCK